MKMNIHLYLISLFADLMVDIAMVLLVITLVVKGADLLKSALLCVMNYIYMKGE